MSNIKAKARELDALFCTHASNERIRNFFNKNQDDLGEIFSKMICRNYLFSPDLIASMDNSVVRKICNFFVKRISTGYADKMHFCAGIIMSEWIAAEKRAMFWHVSKNMIYQPAVFRAIRPDIDCARKAFLFHIMPGEKNDFIQRTAIGTKHFEGTEGIMEGIRRDSVSIFEMNRQAAGQNITSTLLHHLLRSNAVKCFLHLVENFPKPVFECRTAEEWLFIVCHDAREKTAIQVILWFEHKTPGIIARTRDPWGNTLLWHTLARDKADELQLTLILCGCDAHAKNRWGLSWQIVKENTLNEKEFIKCPEKSKTSFPATLMNWTRCFAIMRRLKESIGFFAKIRIS